MNIRIATYILLLGFACPCFAEKTTAEENLSRINLSALAVAASNTALVQFKIEQPNADLQNFHVVIFETPTNFQIAFIANQLPSIKEGCNDDTCFIEIPSAHGNKYGRNITYVISKKSGKIIDFILSK